MQTEIEFGPAYAVAKVTLAGGERVKADGGAMLAMTTGTEIETSVQGGALKGLRRSILGGESFFMNTFTAPPQGGEILFAPKLPGDIVPFDLQGRMMYLTSGNYIASEESVDIDSHWGGAKTFFGSQGLFMLKVQGQGQVIAGSFGAIKPMELQAGESYTIDTGHLVGWEEGIAYEVHKAGSWKSTFLSGEGLVATLTGPGRLYIQTRSAESLLHWIEERMPRNSGS